MSRELIAGFDLGTTFFKVGLYDRDGRQQGLGRRAFPKESPTPGRCEVPVASFRNALKSALADAMAQAECSASEIKGLSYCSQANTFLLLDSDHKPLTPLIVWSDLRADPVPEELNQFWLSEDYLQSTGVGFQGPELMFAKLDFLRRTQPDLWSKVDKVLTISDYLCFLLTGMFVGDCGTGALLGLWDLRSADYYPDSLKLLSLERSQLSDLHRPGSFTAPLSKQAAEWLGLKRGLPVTVGAMDHHTAALGAGTGIVAPVSVSFGTSLVCFRFLKEYQAVQGCCLGPATEDGKYYQMSFNSPGAVALEWYKNSLKPEPSFDELFENAGTVAAGSDGLCAEVDGDSLRFTGESSDHHQGHYARAVMELIGRNVRFLLNELNPPLQGLDCILGVGGGARRDLWMEIVREAAGVDVIAARPADTASKGAALLSAQSLGWFSGLDVVPETWYSLHKLKGNKNES